MQFRIVRASASDGGRSLRQMPTTRPYGSWPSPISADLIVGGSIALSDVSVVDDNIFWVEGRPSRRGAVRSSGGAPTGP
jgi:hypothetical protein